MVLKKAHIFLEQVHMKYEMRPNKKMEKLHQCGLVEAVRRFMLKPHALFIEGSDAISRQMCIVEPI